MKGYFLGMEREQRIAARLMGLSVLDVVSAEDALERCAGLHADGDCAVILFSPRLSDEMRRLNPPRCAELEKWEKPLHFFLPHEGAYARSVSEIPGQALGLKLKL